jgi:hypothetical protein
MPMEHSSRRARLRTRILGILAVVVLPILVSPASATSASWTDPATFSAAGSSGFWLPWYGQLRLDGTTMCLDIPSRNDAAGQALQLYACNTTPAQIWFFDADHRVRVFVQGQNNPTDGATIRCLRYNGAGIAVTIENCQTGQTNQQWTVTASSGGFVVSSVAAPTRCLDVPTGSQTQGTAVVTTTCTATNRARIWDLEFVPTISYA